MDYETFHLDTAPALSSPVFIVGLRGWGNALDVAAGTAQYLVDHMGGKTIGQLDPDRCYRYDEARPVVTIDSGELKSIQPPGGRLFTVESTAHGHDALVLVADEPHLNWYRFTRELVDLATRLQVRAMISLGSMFDNVLHTDRRISAVSTGSEFHGVLARLGIDTIDYHGPSAIHSLLLDTCRRRGLSAASLWCHCPVYLQGITHHGLILALCRLLGDLTGIQPDTHPLQSRWQALQVQIDRLVTDNPRLGDVMDQIRRKKRQGAWQHLKQGGDDVANVIRLQDFLDS